MDDSTTQSPRYYVYVLCRPDGRPFYVGKGQGNRMFHHIEEAKRGHQCHKCNVIRKILRSSDEVQHTIVFVTDDEQDAFTHERKLITAYGRKNLCNLTDGGDGVSGLPLELHPSHKYPEIRQRERNPAAKLTNHQADTIRQRFMTESISLKDLATEYGVTHRTITSVVRQEHWGIDETIPTTRPKDVRYSLIRGAQNSRARFTMEQVREIRQRYANGEVSMRQLAIEYSVEETCISGIIGNRTYHDPSYDESIVLRGQVASDRTGEHAYQAKMNWESVRAIRQRYAAGEHSLDLASEYGVFKSTIVKIIANRTWVDPAYIPPADRADRRYQKLRKMTYDQSREIRIRYAAGGVSYKALAAEYGVTFNAIAFIVRGKTYVKDPSV